jgi:hypothetical protein
MGYFSFNYFGKKKSNLEDASLSKSSIENFSHDEIAAAKSFVLKKYPTARIEVKNTPHGNKIFVKYRIGTNVGSYSFCESEDLAWIKAATIIKAARKARAEVLKRNPKISALPPEEGPPERLTWRIGYESTWFGYYRSEEEAWIQSLQRINDLKED